MITCLLFHDCSFSSYHFVGCGHIIPKFEGLSSVSGIRTSASNDLNRKIVLVQQARAASAVPSVPSVVTLAPHQPSCSTSESPSTIIRNVNLLPGTQKNSPSRENSIPSEETSEDVCADTSQLMRKTNSLPMEVT